MARKPIETKNEIYEYMRHMNDYNIRGMPHWMDDIVMGACYTSVGISKGKLNANPALVKAALFMPLISTATCLNIYSLDSISERTAQRVAKAARFALGGIRMYIENMPEDDIMNVSWKIEKEFRADYYAHRESKYYSAPKAPLPSEISNLKEEGKYEEYGVAVRAFREAELTSDKKRIKT